MAYDEDLADRIRAALEDVEGVTEKRMFGGLAFMVSGNMAVSASGQGGLLVRVDPADSVSFIEKDGVDRFEMGGRSMNGWLHVALAVVQADDELAHWVEVGVRHAASLPKK
jgi:TfoX/Sxy family transcriptional regulator of competence genes